MDTPSYTGVGDMTMSIIGAKATADNVKFRISALCAADSMSAELGWNLRRLNASLHGTGLTIINKPTQ